MRQRICGSVSLAYTTAMPTKRKIRVLSADEAPKDAQRPRKTRYAKIHYGPSTDCFPEGISTMIVRIPGELMPARRFDQRAIPDPVRSEYEHLFAQAQSPDWAKHRTRGNTLIDRQHRKGGRIVKVVPEPHEY